MAALPMVSPKTRSVVVFVACLLLAANWADLGAQEPKENAAATRDYAVALGFQKKKLFPQAAARWTRFIQAYPQDERLPNAHLHLGVCKFREGKFPEAATTFQTVLAKYPKFAQRDAAQFNLALIQYNIAGASQKPDDYKKAAAAFAEVPAKFAKSTFVADARYYRAESLYLSGDKSAAVVAYAEVIKASPNSPLLPEIFYALGTTQQELDKHAEAASTFQQYLKKFPQGAQVNECRLRLGMAQLGLKKFAEAQKLFTQCAAVPNFDLADFALMQQAEAVFQQNKVPNAAVLYESLPKRFAKSPYIGAALLAAGKLRYQAKQYPPAQKSLAAVVAQKLAEAPEAAYWLGRTQLEQKKPADAIKTLETAIAAYPKSEFLPQLKYTRIDALYELPQRQKETVALYGAFAAENPKHARAADALYRAAFAGLKFEDYAAAKEHTAAYLANKYYAANPLTPDVLFINAESCLLAEPRDLVKAEAQYRRLVAEFPKHLQVPAAKVRIGFCLHAAEKRTEAVAYLTAALPVLKERAQKAEAQLLIGRSHRDSKKAKEAVASLRAAYSAFPKWEQTDEVLYLLAASLRDVKDSGGAVTELNRLIGQFPKSGFRDRALYQLAEIAFDQKKYDESIGHYRRVVAEYPKNESAPPAQYRIGMALFAKEQYQPAVVELSKLLTVYAKAPVAANAFHLRGLCYQRLKNYAPAVSDLNRFLSTKPAGTEAFDGRFSLAQCQLGLEQHPQAIGVMESLLKDKPDYAQADRVCYELAFAYVATQKETEAKAAFLRLTANFPESPLVGESWFRIGEMHEKSKQFAEAEKAYASGLQKAKQPELREGLFYNLGGSQHRRKAYADALKTFQTQIKEHPKGKLILDANWMTADCLYRQNKFSEALPHFVKVSAAGDLKYLARALYRSGDCAASVKQWADSQKQYQTLITRFPKFEQINEARYGLGLSLQNQNKLDEAKKVYLQVTKDTNTETAAKSRFMMGECAFAVKKYDEALEHFLEAALGYPYEEWQAHGHFEAARCLIELKQTDKARESLETVVKKFPKHTLAKNAAALLAKLKK